MAAAVSGVEIFVEVSTRVAVHREAEVESFFVAAVGTHVRSLCTRECVLNAGKRDNIFAVFRAAYAEVDRIDEFGHAFLPGQSHRGEVSCGQDLAVIEKLPCVPSVYGTARRRFASCRWCRFRRPIACATPASTGCQKCSGRKGQK